MSAAGPSQGANCAAANAASVGAWHARRFALLLFLAAMVASPRVALAADAVPTEKDAVAASRAVKLSEKLRCLVCQNQTIADSSAELAQDLRRQIREQIAAGRTDDEIVDYMVARYGDFVLYQPPVKATTALLWAGPALLLLIGFFGLARIVRARRAEPEAPQLTAEEHERAARLLGGDGRKGNS
jgi:cytochrome c-type biogenesis protein CcmH